MQPSPSRPVPPRGSSPGSSHGSSPGSPHGSSPGLPERPPARGKASRTTIDGRSARALRTREAIVDACIGLVEEGELRPTAPRVAERAGVSVRSVFQHFADLPALHIAVTERIVERVAVLLHPVDPRAPLDERLPAFVRHRAALLEAVTPFRRAANVHGPFAPEIQRAQRLATEYLRDEVAQAFQPELARVPARERREVLDGLATALSWSAWEALRNDAECSVEQASAVTTRMVTALLLASRARCGARDDREQRRTEQGAG